MADYQRVVEYLRDVRSMQNPPITEELRRYAQEFADLCVQVNERLRKCSSFLQQGLRSEAIHHAEEPPNLLDLVAALDLPDPQLWVEFCQATEMPVPPPLQLDRASQLNEAYAIDQPLEHLLGQHRLLALQRAPIAKRLRIMRQLASQDPGSGFWEKDIRNFERVRLRELPSEFYEAVRRRDDTTVTALVDEIDGQPWYEAVPDDLRAAIGDAFARITRTQLERDLRRQLDAMHEAFSARALDQAVALLAKWNETIKAAGTPNISRDIIDQAAPIAAWVEQENQAAERLKTYKNALSTLTQQLDADAGDAELDSALEQVKRYEEHPLPVALLERLNAVRTRRAQAQKSKHKLRLIMMGTAAGVVLLIASVALFLTMRNRTAAGWASRINITVAGGQAEEVKKVLALQQSQAPQYTTDPDVSAARQKAQNFIHAYEDRVAIVAAAKKQFADWKAAYGPLAADPAQTPDLLLAKAGTLDADIASLPVSALSDDDLKAADPDGSMQLLRNDVATIRAGLRARASGMVRDQLAELQKSLAAVGDGELSPDDAGKLAKVEAAAGQLRDIPGLDDATKQAAGDLASAAVAKRTGAEQAQAMKADLAALLPKTQTIDGYKTALDAFVEAYPQAPQSADFKKASDNLASLKPLDAWREVLAGLGPTDKLAPSSQAAAQKRADAVAAFLKDNAQSPLAAQMSAYVDYLKAAADGLQDKGTLQSAFAELLANPIITDLRYLEDSNGRRYYVLDANPSITTSSMNGHTSIHFEMIDPVNPLRKKSVDIDPPLRLKGEKPQAVPHVALATDIDGRIRAIDENNWDTTGFDLIDAIAGAPADVDPVVRVVMLQTAITAVKQIDGPMIGDVYDKTLQNLNRLNIGQQPSLLGKPVPPAAVTQLNAILAAMPKSQAVKADYIAKRNELFSALAMDASLTGMLIKDNGAPVVLPRSAPAAGMIARAAGAGGMILVGRFADGKWVMEDSAASLPQGTLLFISR